MSRRLELDVTYAARRPWAPRPGQFKTWAAGVVAGVAVAQPRPVALSIRVVGAARSRGLNSQYRGKDQPTNVLSFGGAGRSPDGRDFLGELVICAPVVAREARAQGKIREAHWAHMTVHGMLHLLGYDHELAKQARRMAAVEVQILDRLGFSNPYA